MKSPNPFPGEIWCIIYLNLQDPIPLTRTNRYLKLLLDNPFMITQWIIHRYTLEFAFMGALNWYLDRDHKCIQSKCNLETRQIQVASYLISMNFMASDLEEYVMKDASKMRHLRYVEWILNSQSENTDLTPRCNLLLEAIDAHDDALIQLLSSYKATTQKAIETAFTRELSPILFNTLVQELEPSINLIMSCLSKSAVTKWFSFKKRQDETFERIHSLFKRMSDQVFRENADQLMISASELGSITLVKHLKERGGNINLERGAALYTALLVGNISLIKYLVSLPETSLDIFTIPRATLVTICILDHIAVLYALISTTTSVTMSLICKSQGYAGSTLNVLAFDYNNTCTDTLDGHLEQQLVACLFSFVLFLLLQIVMPLYGISGSLLTILFYKRQRGSVHPFLDTPI